jgi:serine/threonine-protein kinase
MKRRMRTLARRVEQGGGEQEDRVRSPAALPDRNYPRRLRHAAQGTSSGRSLSSELEWAAARRLGALAVIVAAVSTAVSVLEIWAGRPSVVGVPTRIAMVAAVVAVSVALWAAIAARTVSGTRALSLGFVYEVTLGFLMALGFHAATVTEGVQVRGWTPVAVWASLFPLIVPATTRRVAIATVATTAMDPLGLWLLVKAGAPRPPLGEVAQLFVPDLVACIVAPLTARIVYGLTTEVKRAREMGSYRLVERLGQGGMGEVWRAEHRMLARAAAIKLIRPSALGAGDGSTARELVSRFEREAQATARLRSPHTIAVYDYGVAADGTFHYVMELLEGFSLQGLVDRFGPVPPERAIHLLRQACHSLAEAHAHGLVHRDIKPANLFVCRQGLDVDFVKVLDFGLVKVQGGLAPGTESLTVQGSFAGTPGFMPPEVALGAERVDGRADLYALGCVAYWLLTGRRVFENESPMQMVIDHVRTPPVPPSQRSLRPVPEALERLVMRCLEKDPAQRPASARELAAELDALPQDSPWTEARAQDWWEQHPPAPAPDGGAPEGEPTPSAPRKDLTGPPTPSLPGGIARRPPAAH